MLVIQLHDILSENKLTSWFQPIVNLKTAEILGYEAVVRGPSNSPLHAPEILFAVAEECGRLEELENACLSSHLKSFIDLQLKGSVFLNVSPQSLASPRRSPELTKRFLAKMGLSPDRVVIELTEHRPVDNSQALCAAVANYRKLGFGVAIDDLGAGYNGLKLWSEVRPDYLTNGLGPGDRRPDGRVRQFPDSSRGRKRQTTWSRPSPRTAQAASQPFRSGPARSRTDQSVHGQPASDRGKGHARRETQSLDYRRGGTARRTGFPGHRPGSLSRSRHTDRSSTRGNRTADSPCPIRQPPDHAARQCTDQRAHRLPVAKRRELRHLLLRPGSVQAVQRSLWLWSGRHGIAPAGTHPGEPGRL